MASTDAQPAPTSSDSSDPLWDLPPAVMRQATAVIQSINNSTVVAIPTHLQRAYFRTLADVLKNPSLARRRDMAMARQMRNDPEIEAPLLQLKIAVSSLDWQIVPPEGSKDTTIADFVSKKVSEIRQFPDLQAALLNSVFYGPAAVNLIWERCEDGTIGTRTWLPIHSDTLVFSEMGKVGIRTGSRFIENKDRKVEMGYDSYIHWFTDEERYAVALMTFQRQGPEFDEVYEAAYAYAGRGLRDVIWYYWLLKQTVMQNWGAYAERFAMGIKVGYYPLGQENGASNMQTALRNLSSDVCVALPRSTPGEKDYEIELMEPTAGRANTFADLTERLMGKVKELILGQPGTTQTAGSSAKSVSLHGKTFNRHTKYIADCLAEVITDEIVRRIVDLNFGPQKEYPRFKYSVADPDAAEWIGGVREYINAGGEVRSDEVRERLGITKPRPGDDILSLETIDAAFGATGGAPLGGVQAKNGKGDGKKSKGTSDNERTTYVDHLLED